ncbi:MAG TPA: LysR family transcriptional regulator [Myxococcales bacterium LLY-WYZ-16_1]|nr:LysR family transcriptional regulator [Myxococcales bacterium LLY-WYZ-16_1]
MDRLALMELFVRVAESGSITAGGRDLGLSQARASRGVKQLESALQTTLLHRTTRQVALTPEGERFLVAARVALEAVDAANASVREPSELHGRIRLSAPVGYGQRIVAPAVDAFTEAHAGLQVDLHLSDRFVDLVSEGFDLAIRLGELPSSSLRSRRLGMAFRAIVVAPSYSSARPIPRSPEDLADHEFLVFTRLQSAKLQLWQEDRVRAIEVSGRLAADHLPTLRDWCLRGRGVGLLPLWLIREDVRRGRLVRLLPSWHPPPLPIWALLPPSAFRPARVQALLDHIADWVASHPTVSPSD